MRKRAPTHEAPDTPEEDGSVTRPDGTSRRDFLKTGAVGVAALKKHRQLVLESRQYLFSEAGFNLNVLA
jgi:hypothetical protein